jgi:hypothetical protein
MSSCQARDDQCGSAVGERRSAAKTTARLLRPPFLYARACVRVCLFVCECVCLCGKAQSTGIVFCNKSETPLCHIATCTQRVGRPPWGGVRMPLGHWGTQSTPLGHSEYPLGHSEYSLGALRVLPWGTGLPLGALRVLPWANARRSKQSVGAKSQAQSSAAQLRSNWSPRVTVIRTRRAPVSTCEYP